MIKQDLNVKFKGIVRIKKFKIDQDEAIDEPEEVCEQKFELNLEDLIKGNKNGTY